MTLLGRQLLSYERVDEWVLDPDTMERTPYTPPDNAVKSRASAQTEGSETGDGDGGPVSQPGMPSVSGPNEARPEENV